MDVESEVTDVLCDGRSFTALMQGGKISGVGTFFQSDCHNGGCIEGVIHTPEKLRGTPVIIEFTGTVGTLEMRPLMRGRL